MQLRNKNIHSHTHKQLKIYNDSYFTHLEQRKKQEQSGSSLDLPR